MIFRQIELAAELKAKREGIMRSVSWNVRRLDSKAFLLWMTTAKERETVFPGRHLHCFQPAAPSPMSGVRVFFAVHFVREDTRKS